MNLIDWQNLWCYKKRIYVFLFAIFLCGLFLRIFKIDEQSLWWDEGYSLALANDIKNIGIKAILPNYSVEAESFSTDKPQVLFHLLKSFLPHSWPPEWRSRAWSALFSFLSLIIFYKWFVCLKLSKNSILFGILIAATSPFLIYFAKEGRPYSLVLFLSLLFLLLFEKYHNLETIKEKLLIILCLVALGYTQLITLILPLIYIGWKILHNFEENKIRQWLSILVSSLLLLTPVFYLAWIHRNAPIPMNNFSIYNFLYAFSRFFVGFSFGPSNYALHLIKDIIFNRSKPSRKM